ncbi:MAG TPA: 2-oxoglutarate dehydrogenase E1 component, partial [Bdellovibrionota bacterium]|nr:2-oxoglutarate dehydrogenase E1 component [Bdellovibrionota bacterium]
MEKFSYLKSINAEYIEELFARYLEDPSSIDPSWRYFFEGLELAGPAAEALQNGNGHALPNGAAAKPQLSTANVNDLTAEARVAELIQAYRELGRLLAAIDPLSAPPASHPLLELSRFELSNSDLSKTFNAGKLIGAGPSKLSDIIARLRETYCGSIGVEFTHIQDPAEREWLQRRMETSRNREDLDVETRKQILKRLTQSESFEKFLHTRYVAQKRFSIEGGESLIPALDCMIEVGAELGAKEFVMGMAHRGRLNVLTNIFGKKPEFILTEFEGAYKADTSLGEGDVKYHMGYSADHTTRLGKQVHLSLGYNPSHLEFINSVIVGISRAKQTYLSDTDRSSVIPIQIHGDAAFAGQGVCYETLNLSQLGGYATGGSLHVVINNQVGFTTSPKDARSTTYSTDLAKMLETPIFHVNGDDPEAIWFVSKLAIEYRQKFKKDVFIDLVCYRRHGHNEGDEPAYTQPILYKKIKSHPTTRELYAKKLTATGVAGEGEAQGYLDGEMQRLTEAQARTKAEPPQPFVSAFEGRWKGFRRPNEDDLTRTYDTTVQEKTLRDIAERINLVPPGFHLHPKLARFFDTRLKAVRDGTGIDWGCAEALAYASLLNEGYPVRLSGQDAERGTFSHRHSVLNDFETGETYVPLNQIRPGQAQYEVHNSHLSETAVMGFEYGYSLADPLTLVIWEAQFGDFANGAQVIIDQFLASSESKWHRMSGLTLLLPHGYEGQGPEHSSARLERFLQLAGKNNLTVCNFTTPAQLFHAFRRQVKRPFRKPLVIMSPKSLLRHPSVVSSLDELARGSFQEALDDPEFSNPQHVAQVSQLLL